VGDVLHGRRIVPVGPRDDRLAVHSTPIDVPDPLFCIPRPAAASEALDRRTGRAPTNS